MGIAPSILIEPPTGATSVGETRVNTTTAGEQTDPVVTALSGGGYIISWISAHPDGTYGVYTQRYDAFGAARGAQTFVNIGYSGFLAQPSVAELSSGGYAVAYTSYGLTRDGDNTGVYLQRYDDAGMALGAEIRVNDYTSNVQSQPTVLGFAMGRFGVVWMSSGQDGSSDGIYTRIYSDAGATLVAETRVNAFTAGAQYEPAAVVSAGTGYVVVWSSQNQDGSGYGVYAQSYNSEGYAIGGETLVNSFTTGGQFAPAVAEIFPNDYVVTWVSENQDGSGYGIYAQRYGFQSGRLGFETRVNTTTANLQTAPAVAGLEDGGYVITWSSLDQDGSSWGVYAQRYDRDGVAVGGETRINTTTAGAQQAPSVAGLTGGGYVVTWQSELQDGSGNGIYHAVHDNEVFAAIEQVPLDLKGRLQLADADAGNAPLMLIIGADYGLLEVSVGDSGVELVAGGSNPGAWFRGTLAQLNALLGLGGTSTLRYLPNTDAPPEGASLHFDVRDGTGNVIFAGAAIAITQVNDAPTVTITPTALAVAGSPALVDALADTSQGRAAIAALDDGTYLVAWNTEEYRDVYITRGISAQLYSADGTRIGTEFAVNAYATDAQSAPSVASGDAGFVVAWTSAGQDGSGLGVFAQRLNPDGSKAGSEFQVNTTTAYDQYDPSVAILYDGTFVVSWTSYNQVGPYSVFAQRFAADGTKLGGEFAVESQAGVQGSSEVVALASGWFQVTWTSQQYDGYAEDIYSQSFYANGSKYGSAFRINDPSYGTQQNASVAALPSGPFVVAWETANEGISARLFSSGGFSIGNEFRVDNPAGGRAEMPSVAAAGDGGFVITWSGNRAQKFAADGSRIGTEFLVGPAGVGTSPDVAAVGDGFVVGWDVHGAQNPGLYTRSLAPIYVAVGRTPVDLQGTLRIADADAAGGTMTATLSVGVGTLHAAVGDSGASVVSGNGTANLVLSGTLAQLNALFGTQTTDTLTYLAPTVSGPSTTLTLSVNDNGNAGVGGGLTASASATIAITAVNDPPVVANLPGDAATYTEGGGAVRLDVGGNATIVDDDSADFAGGRLALVVTAPADDLLEIVNQGTAPGQIGVDETYVSFGGVPFGTVSAGGPGQLAIQFNANATAAAVQALVRNITYGNAEAENPTAGTRTIQWLLVDGDGTANGGDQDVAFTSTVAVVAVNDAPVARPDAVATAENAVGAGNVFLDNGSGVDGDVDGPALTVAMVNGSAASVGTQITLASGARLTVNAGGGYVYAPSGKFDYLVSAAKALATGAVNTSATDSFSYTLAGGNTVTVTVTVTGVDGAGDELRGSTGADTLTGGAGLDIMRGGDGDDTLTGGAGNDTIEGNNGQDWLQGGADNDIESGGAGHDSVWGGAGNDVLEGGPGDDTLVGNEGSDGVSYAAATAGVEVDLSWIEDQDTRGAGVDTLFLIENLIGSGFADVLKGSAVANGLAGGAGADVLTGGAGNDLFSYFSLTDSTVAAADRITDFEAGKDRLDVSAIDADTGTAGNQEFHLGATAGRSGDVVLAFDAGTGRTSVSFYVNGDAVADMVVLLDGNHMGLGTGDFVL